MTKRNQILLAFAGGLAAGAALGVLFAPESGKSTRDKLSYRLDKYLDRLNVFLANANKGTDENGDKQSDLNAQDYRKAKELLEEVETMLSEISDKNA